MINVMLTEDHNVVRTGIKSLFDKEKDLQVVAEATNSKQTLKILSTGLDVDIILADINMPETTGIEMTAIVKEKYPKVKVVILSMLDHEKYIIEAFKAGASGFILKNVTKDELVFALKHVCISNERYICSELALRLLNKLLYQPIVALPDELSKLDLSKRETEVLILIAEGLTNQKIADQIFTSKRTVEGHRQSLIEKTGSKNTAALIRFAVLNGLIR